MAVYNKDYQEAADGLVCPECGSDNIIVLAVTGGTFLCEDCAYMFGHMDDLFEDIYDK